MKTHVSQDLDFLKLQRILDPDLQAIIMGFPPVIERCKNHVSRIFEDNINEQIMGWVSCAHASGTLSILMWLQFLTLMCIFMCMYDSIWGW